MKYLGKYTEQEVDAVIDAFDLGFMRDRLKASEPNLRRLTRSMFGAGAVLRVRVAALGEAIVSALPGRVQRWLRR